MDWIKLGTMSRFTMNPGVSPHDTGTFPISVTWYTESKQEILDEEMKS